MHVRIHTEGQQSAGLQTWRYLDMPEFDVSFASDGDIVTSRVTAADYQDARNQIYDKYNGECQVIDVRIVE